MIAQACRFGLVGALATLVHLGLGLRLLAAGLPLQKANGLAFCIALVDGFVGHYRFSFRDQPTSHVHSFWRYFFVVLRG